MKGKWTFWEPDLAIWHGIEKNEERFAGQTLTTIASLSPTHNQMVGCVAGENFSVE